MKKELGRADVEHALFPTDQAARSRAADAAAQARAGRGRWASLSFAHPAYLWGALALALPILIHLFSRRRPRPLPFGAIELVLRSQRQKRRNLRLRHFLLLLALRCLLVAGIALALARPSLQPKTGAPLRRAGPARPRWCSMLRSRCAIAWAEKRSSSGRARRRWRRSSTSRPRSRRRSVSCSGPGRILPRERCRPSFDRAAARRILQSAQPSYVGLRHDRLPRSRAARALGESVLARESGSSPSPI